MTIHGVLAVITFVESWINTPSESIPEPGSENKEDNDNKDEKSEDEGQFKILRFRSFVYDRIYLGRFEHLNFRNSIIYVSSIFHSLYPLISDDVHHSPSLIGN